VVDGPGRRVVLYLQGCRILCPWCHSPHSRPTRPRLLFFAERCIGCGKCAEVCGRGVHTIDAAGRRLDRSHCRACGRCVEACPVSGNPYSRAAALRLTGEAATPEEMFARLAPELELLGAMGGLTLSGGEPMMQPGPAMRLLELCRETGIHTALETSGVAGAGAVERLLPLVDCWLFGLRPLPPGHPAAPLVGDPEKVTANLRLIATRTKGRIILRLPVIPGHTDSIATWEQVAATMAELDLAEINLLPFNPFAAHYFDAAGEPFPLREAVELGDAVVSAANAFFAARGAAVTVVSENASPADNA